jgi:hypothetical protein
MRRRLFAIPVTVVAIATIVLSMSGVAVADNNAHLQTILRGEEEVPGPGDPDGKGFADIQIRAGQGGALCYILFVTRIDFPSIGAHIHEAPRGVAGPIVVSLLPPTPLPDDPNSGISSGCIYGIPNDLLRDIAAHPRDYYVNVHNNPYPAGAIRGQLRPAFFEPARVAA